jgi:hypothetical protein
VRGGNALVAMLSHLTGTPVADIEYKLNEEIAQ